jgi:hypothetical protein
MGLFRYVLCELPSPNPMQTRLLVRQFLFGAMGESLFNPLLLGDIDNAAKLKTVDLLPDKGQAMDYFNRLVVWRAKDTRGYPFEAGWSQTLLHC